MGTRFSPKMQTKRFTVYQTPKRSVNNPFQLQILVKKNLKTIKSLECEEGPTGSNDNTDLLLTENPRLAKFIIKNKFVSSYKHTNYSKRSGKCIPIFNAVKNIHSLTELRLVFTSDHSFKPKLSKAFTHCTKNLKRLVSLDCCLDRSVVIYPTESLQSLHFIAPLHSLSHLSLSVYSSQWLNDKSWSTFTYHIPDLTSLSLNLNYIKNLTQKNLITIFSILTKLHRLASLDLQVLGLEVLDFSTLMLLFENLKSLLHFQSLTLCLTDCNHLKSDGKDPLSVGLALLNPSSFCKLSLEFYPNFTDSDLSKLLITISRFSSLKDFSLRFSHLDQVTSQGLAGLSATLSQFTALQALSILINRAMDPAVLLESISFCLKDLQELVSLTLDTWFGKTIDNPGIQHLCSHLSELPKLQHLNLNCGPKSRFNAQSIESLSQALRKLTGLKDLQLDCCAEDNSAENIFDDLLITVGNLQNLRRLNLSWGGPFDLQKETVEIVITSLKSFKCLTELTLGFDMCCMKSEISEQLMNLILALESQSKLKEIFVSMPSPWEENAFREDQSFMELRQRVQSGAKKFEIHGYDNS